MTTMTASYLSANHKNAGRDYALYRISDTEWEILETTYSDRGGLEMVIANFTSEDEATVAFEQLLAAVATERGVSHLGKLTPVWDIKWFDATEFAIGTTSTTNEGLKNDVVETLESEGTPYRVTEAQIEHWTENPLFAL